MGKCSDDVASGGRSSQQSDDVPLSLLKRAICWGDCRPSLGLVALFSAEKKGRGEADGGERGRGSDMRRPRPKCCGCGGAGSLRVAGLCRPWTAAAGRLLERLRVARRREMVMVAESRKLIR